MILIIIIMIFKFINFKALIIYYFRLIINFCYCYLINTNFSVINPFPRLHQTIIIIDQWLFKIISSIIEKLFVIFNCHFFKLIKIGASFIGLVILKFTRLKLDR